MFKNYPDVVKVSDIQKMLGVCKSTAYQLLQDKIIHSVRIGKKYIIPKQSVINYLTTLPEPDIMDEYSRLVISKEDCKQ